MSNSGKKIKFEFDSIASVIDKVEEHKSDDVNDDGILQSSSIDFSCDFDGYSIQGKKKFDHMVTANENLSPVVVKPVAVSVNLLDLDDNCLIKILESNGLSIMDLCSVTQCCVRFRDIGHWVFQRNYQKRFFDKMAMVVPNVTETRRLYRTFGRMILELTLYHCSYSIAYAIVESCDKLETLSIHMYMVPDRLESIQGLASLFENLKRLYLHDVDIDDPAWATIEGITLGHTTPNGHSLNVFSSCNSLIELKVVDSYQLEPALFSTTFPNLQHFECRGWTRDTFEEDFLLRHKKLKTFCLVDGVSYDHVPVLRSIVNCKLLEKLKFQFEFDNEPHSIDNDESLKCLENLQNLKELIVKHVGENGRNLIALLPRLASSLEVLEVENVRKSPGLIAVLSKLEKLRVFKVYDIDELNDVNDIIKCKHLTELSFISAAKIKFHPIQIVSGLDKLTKFKCFVNGFRIFSSLYNRLVDVVASRPVWTDRVLNMECLVTDDFKDLLQSPMVRIDTKRWYHSLQNVTSDLKYFN